MSAAERVAGMWQGAGDSRKALEQTWSDSEPPFSLKRQEMSQPDRVGQGWGGGIISAGPQALLYKLCSRRAHISSYQTDFSLVGAFFSPERTAGGQ